MQVVEVIKEDGEGDLSFKIKNAGLIPCVLVFDPTEKISYRVLPRGNATEIEIGTETESETTAS